MKATKKFPGGASFTPWTLRAPTGPLGPQLHRRTVTQAHSYTGAQLHRRTVIQAHSCTGAQL